VKAEKPLFQQDLNHILEHTRDLWEEVRGENIFITGGTGFFGCWLLESFHHANRSLNLGAKLTVLSRNPESFKNRMPHLSALEDIYWLQGDVCSFEFPQGIYSFIIHAATESGTQLNQKAPLVMFNTIVNGTQRVLDFASTHGAQKVLLTSSGAVYGKQPPELLSLPESYCGAPDPCNPLSAYAEGKRAAELLINIYASQSDMQVKIARCFAFVGPHLPLDAHFAIGNFIRDGMQGGPIVVKGDGTPYRSYLYAADLTIWLGTILFKGQSCYPYNVGSDETIDIKSLADCVRDVLCPHANVLIAQPFDPIRPIERYIPSTKRAAEELGLSIWNPLERSIEKTVSWWRD